MGELSGLISGDPNTPPARIQDAMLDGRVIYLMSGDLLDEYSNVLRRASSGAPSSPRPKFPAPA